MTKPTAKLTEAELEARDAALPLTSDWQAIQAWGYTVTPTGEGRMPYRISGPRNVRYVLCRSAFEPTTLFAVYDRPGKFGVARVHGYKFFAERDGKLVPVK